MSVTQKPNLTKTGATSRDYLREDYVTAAMALTEAISKLARACPNARDYTPDAFRIAEQEHRARVNAVTDVALDIDALLQHLDS